MIWVIDASVVARWYIEEEAHAHADRVLEGLVHQPGLFAVPELFAFEVFAVLQRLHPRALDCFTRGVIPLLQGGLLRQPMTTELAALAEKYVGMGLTGYDACYAALAEDLKGQWLTFNRKSHQAICASGVSWLLEESLPHGI